MSTVKKTIAAIGRAVVAILVPIPTTRRDVALRIYPRVAYAW